MSKIDLNNFSDPDADKSASARAWKNTGGKVVGYLSNNVPLEIIYAAGMMPYHLDGKPNVPTPLADEFMEPAFDPLTRSIFERVLSDEFDFLDAIVLPRTNDAQQRLYYYLCEIERSYPQYKLPPVYLLDMLHTQRPTSDAHNAMMIQHFKQFIESVSGNPVADENLTQSVSLYNRLRDALLRVTRLRSRSPAAISGVETQHLYGAVRSLPPEQSLALVLDFIQTAEGRELAANDNRPRIVIAGNGFDHDGLHQLIEKHNAVVVGDYHAMGNHFLTARVTENDEPLVAICQHYHYQTLSCRSFIHPDDVVTFAEQQKADGIIFHYMLREEALTWHYPKQSRAAQQAGLKTLLLTDQPYAVDELKVSPPLQNFIEVCINE